MSDWIKFKLSVLFCAADESYLVLTECFHCPGGLKTPVQYIDILMTGFFFYMRHDNLWQCIVFVNILWVGEHLCQTRQHHRRQDYI